MKSAVKASLSEIGGRDGTPAFRKIYVFTFFARKCEIFVEHIGSSKDRTTLPKCFGRVVLLNRALLRNFYVFL